MTLTKLTAAVPVQTAEAPSKSRSGSDAARGAQCETTHVRTDRGDPGACQAGSVLSAGDSEGREHRRKVSLTEVGGVAEGRVEHTLPR